MSPKARGDSRAARRRKRRTQESRSLPLLPIAIGVIVVLAVVAIVLTSNSGGQEGEVEIAENVEVEGDALPEYNGSENGVGQEAPTLTGVNFSGEPESIRPGDGPMAILFLAHWCPHCQREVTALTDWLEDNDLPAGVDIMTVSTSADSARPNWPPSAWLENEGWTFPVLVDDAEGSAANAFGLSGTPYWVFLDGEGQVVTRASGQVPIADLERILEELAAG